MKCIYAVLLLCALSLCSCSYQPPEVVVTQENDELIIKSGKHTIYARETGRKRTEEFLLVGGTGRGMYPFTAHFSAVPSSKLERFKREFKNFWEGDSHGEMESSHYANSMFLYPIHQAVAENILEVDSLAMSWNYPLIRMTFIEIDITKHIVTVLGREVEENPDDYAPCYLVIHIEVVQENYAKNL